MTPDKIERVFGRGRLKMATGEHVEVFREAVAPGERRRYTKRFLETGDADFRQWTQREWRILARLIGHGVRCVPDVVQFDGGAKGGMRQVQTYDAGITVDQWATLLPVTRDGMVRRHMFEDCAHWWALAHHCLVALDEIHRLQLVHLDIKADNICIPYDPAAFDPSVPEARLYPAFSRLALIDFAFSLVSREPLATALPLGWQKDYDYQSPRLLRALEAGGAGELGPTQELDWRCDLYSLAAMLRRYLPDDEWARSQGHAFGWTSKRYEDARSLVYRLRECHDRDVSSVAPHAELVETTGQQLAASDLAASLASGWLLAEGDEPIAVPRLATPMTRIAAPRIAVTPAIAAQVTAVTEVPAVFRNTRAHVFSPLAGPMRPRSGAPRFRAPHVALAAALGAAVIGASVMLGFPEQYDHVSDTVRAAADRLKSALIRPSESASTHVATAEPARSTPAAPETNAPAKVSAEADTTKPLERAIDEAMPRPDSSRAPPIDAGAESANDSASAPEIAAPVSTTQASEPAQTPASATQASETAQTPASTPHASEPAQDKRNAATSVPSPVAAPQAAVSSRSSARTSKRSAAVAAQAQPRRPAVVATAPRMSTPLPHARALPNTPAPAGPAKAVPVPNVDLAAAAKATQALVNASVANVKQTSTIENAPVSASTPPALVAEANAPRSESVDPSPPAVASARSAPPSDVRSSAPARRETRRPAVAAPSPPTDPWRAALHDMLAALGVKEQRPAPVEERSLGASSSSSVATQAPSHAPQKLAPVEARGAEIVRPVPAAPITAPVPSPERIADALSPPIPSRTTARDDGNADVLRYQARHLITVDVPRIAAMAQNDMAPVLWNAAGAEYPAQDRAVLNAALGTWPSERAPITGGASSPRGHQLYADAKQAFASGRDQEALDLGMRAFAASPRDPEVAGFLALLHLRVKPVQPELARQLALYALAASGSSRSVRLEDWNTFAVASALSGRDSDAMRALLAELALSTDLERSCRAALGAYNMYGERLRAPVQAMLYRVHAQGRDRDSIACRWGSTRSMRYAGVDSGRY